MDLVSARGQQGSPLWESLRRRPIAYEVFDQLAREILIGERAVGSALPPERELAERFGVSRLVLRQAIHRLAAMDLVRVRQGAATLVLDPDACDHPEVGALILRFSPEADDAFNALRERQIAGSLGMLVLAARRIAPQHIERLREILADEVGATDDFDRIAEPFWTCIAEATGNAFFRRETRYWFRIARENPRVGQRTHLASPERIAVYRAVADKLEQGEGATEAYLETAEELLALVAQDAAARAGGRSV